MMSREYRIETNKILLTECDLWDEFTTKALKNGEEEDYYKIISDHIDEQLDKCVEMLESPEGAALFQSKIDYRKNVFAALDEELEESINYTCKNTEHFIEDLYKKASEKGYKDVEQEMDLTDTDLKAIGLLKEYNYRLIRSVSQDVIDTTRYATLRGVVTGDSIYEMADRIRMAGLETLPGSTLTALQRATMIARTETARIKHMATLQAYANVGLKHCKILTAEDNHVCYICLRNAYEFNEDQKITYENRGDERIHSLDSVQPCIPAHPNCRCAVIPYLEEGEILSPVDNPRQINLINDDRLQMIRDENGNPIPIIGSIKSERKHFSKIYDLVDLTPLQRDVLTIYTKGGNTAINNYLRGYKNKRQARRKWNNARKDINRNITFNEALKTMNEIFEQGIPLKQDIMVVRREIERTMKPDDAGNFKAEGIVATSIKDCVNLKLYGENVNYIKLEKGTKILYLEHLSQFKKDYEIILPHESEFKYIGEKGKMGKIWKYNNI